MQTKCQVATNPQTKSTNLACDVSSEISVTETITETQITDPTLVEMETMVIFDMEII